MLWVPWVLAGSLFAWASCSWVSQNWLKGHPLLEVGLLGYNPILAGGWLGMVVQPGLGLFGAAALSGILCGLLQWLWLQRAPKGLSFLSWPFVVSASTLTLAARQFPTLIHVITFPPYPISLQAGLADSSVMNVSFWCKHFLVSMGSVPFLPMWWFGLILVLALMVSHRHLLKCTLVAWLAGSSVQILLSQDAFFLLNVPVGFNFMLMGMAWHTFFPPLERSWPLLAIGSAFCGVLLIPTQQLANILGLSTFSLPFSTTMLICLLLLRRNRKHQTA